MFHLLAAVVVILAATGHPGAIAQVPDNRGLTLDPDDPGTPAYEGTLDERDRQRLEGARESGDTFVPTLSGRPNGGTAAPPAPAPGPAGAPAVPGPQPAAVDPPAPPPVAVLPEEENGLATQIRTLLEALNRSPQTVRLRYPSAPDRSARAPRAPDSRAPPPPPAAVAGVRGGDGLYARTVYAVNSDYSGPVVLEILQPPLEGAVATGRFERVRDRLVVRLDRLEHRGRAITIDAWAVGLDCACYGIAGNVDRHWFERLLLPAAVRFAEGFFTARSEPEQTIRLDDGTVHETSRRTPRQAVHAGAANAARTAGDILLQDAPTAATVRIPRNSELVLVFARAPGPAAIPEARRPSPPPGPAGESGDE